MEWVCFIYTTNGRDMNGGEREWALFWLIKINNNVLCCYGILNGVGVWISEKKGENRLNHTMFYPFYEFRPTSW